MQSTPKNSHRKTGVIGVCHKFRQRKMAFLSLPINREQKRKGARLRLFREEMPFSEGDQSLIKFLCLTLDGVLRLARTVCLTYL